MNWQLLSPTLPAASVTRAGRREKRLEKKNPLEGWFTRVAPPEGHRARRGAKPPNLRSARGGWVLVNSLAAGGG